MARAVVILGGLAALAAFGAFGITTMRRGKVTIEDVATPSVGPPLPYWWPPSKYSGAIASAESRNGLPPSLLGRTLYQESRYREDIITGQIVSSAGAVGIAQIVPKWHPTVNPLDWRASVEYAAKYLKELYRQFGNDWRKALAAYNWGPGNLSRVNTSIPLWLSQTPTETRNYVNQITTDVAV